VIIAIILWRVFIRLRRSIGRQLLSKTRPWITVCLYALVSTLVLMGAIGQPMNLLVLLGGAAVGLALAIYGLRLARFEVTPDGLYYTPSAHIGVAVSLLLIGRIIYRWVQVGFLGTAGPAPGTGPGALNSPLTLALFGTMAGYFTTYAIGLLRWRAGLPAMPAPQPAEPQG
jgi:hypothetical protein